MNRSITLRNLAGGFLGGSLGILVSWYLDPMALPFGVLLGVVVGWWAEDIVQMFIHSFHAALRLWRVLMERIVSDEIRLPHRSFFGRFKMLLGPYSTKIGSGISRFFGCAAISFRWLAMGVRASARTLMQTVRWASHPPSTALLITISAIAVGAAINAVAFMAFWPWPETMIIGGGASGKPEQVVPFTFSHAVAFTCLPTMFLTMFGLMGALAENADNNPMRNFYLRWERYSQYSPAAYFLRELFRFFKSEVTVAAFAALTVAYWVTLGGALIALVTIPVATFVAFMIGLYKIAQRSAHWWCFGITLATTGISALIFYNSFGNEAVLWTVALCTGLASGALTEGLRRLGLWWGNTEMGQYYLDIWYDEDKILPFSIATPMWRTLWRACDNVSQRMIRSAA